MISLAANRWPASEIIAKDPANVAKFKAGK